MYAVLLLLLSTCSSSRVATRVIDWDESMVRGPIRLTFTLGHTNLVEIDRLDLYAQNEHVQVFARIADTAGNLFRLPGKLRASWTLMGADDKDPFYLQGYDEDFDPGQTVRNIKTRGGYSEGQYLYFMPFRPKPNIAYGFRVTVQLEPNLLLENFLPVSLRYLKNQ